MRFPFLPSLHRAPCCRGGLALLLLGGLSACPADDTDDTTTGAGDSTTSTSSPATDDGNSGPAGSSDDGGTGSSGRGDETGDSGDASTGEPGTSTGSESLEIAGTWLEDLGGGDVITHEIQETSWATSSPFGDALYHIELYDDEARWVIALGDETNEFFPGLYNKFDWHWEGDALYYCTAVYDAASAEEAMAAPDADPGDLITGCGASPGAR